MGDLSFHQLDKRAPEKLYSSVVSILLFNANSTHITEPEKEHGKGRTDVTIIPKHNSKYNRGLILEFKVSKEKENMSEDAQKALEQIINKEYDRDMRKINYLSEIIYIGMSFLEKKLKFKLQ